MPCTFKAMKELPFEKFKMLREDIKTQKLIIAFEKIAMHDAHDKWIFKCCRNYYVVEEIYKGLLDMMCNIWSFAYFLLEDDNIETRPACSGHKPSVFGLDFLVTDLEVMLDVFYKGLGLKFAVMRSLTSCLSFHIALTACRNLGTEVLINMLKTVSRADKCVS